MQQKHCKVFYMIEFKSRKCEFLCEERTIKKIKTYSSGNQTNDFSEFIITPCSGANENAGTRVNPGLVNRLTNRGLRNAF